MIEARTPDGAIHQFPDGTPDDVIDKAVAAHVAAAGGPPATGLLHNLALGTRDVIQGAAALPGMAVDAVTWPARAIQRAVGIPTTAPSDLLTQGLDASGLPTPQTPGEQMRSSAIQGAASVLPTAGLGAVPAVAEAFPAAANALSGGLASQIGSGASAGAAGEAARQSGASPLVQTGAGLAGGLIGGYGAGKISNAGARVGNATAGNTTPLVDAYDRLGMDKTLIGDVSGRPGAQMLQTYASQSPFGSSVLQPVEQRVVGQFGDAVEQTAAQLGTSRHAQAAGEVLQNEARNWRDNVFPARQDAAYAPVNARMSGAAVEPDEYRASLSNLASKLSSLPETQKAMLPSRMQTLLDAINKDVPEGGSIPWETAQELRSSIGRIMGVPEIVQAVGKDQLNSAYGGIARDMDRAATTAGVGDMFKQANAVSTQGHAFIDNVLSKVIRSNNPMQESVMPERAADTILRSGDTTLQALRQEMPHAADELAAYKLRDMALAKPGAAGSTGAGTSVATFLTDLNRLRQDAPAGTAALYGGGAGRRVDDLATVADSIKDTSARMNTSRSGPYVAAAQIGPAAYAGYQAGGLRGALAAAAVPLIANRLAGGLAKSPTLTSVLAAPGPRALSNPLLTPALAAALGNASRN